MIFVTGVPARRPDKKGIACKTSDSSDGILRSREEGLEDAGRPCSSCDDQVTERNFGN